MTQDNIYFNIMTKAEIREYEQTRLRVKYNNEWPSARWMSPLQEELMVKINKAELKQVFFPLFLEEDKAVDLLFKDARLNRLLSTLFDMYDELPLRPDTAFDVTWRSLEIVIQFYLQKYYPMALKSNNKRKPVSVEHKINTVTDSVFKSQLNNCKPLMDVFERLVDKDVSWSALHYIVARMFLPGELQVKTQYELVSARCKDILGVNMYDDIKEKYIVDDKLTADNHRKAERLLHLIIKGSQITLGKHTYHELNLQTRITFIISGILYSSRCERYHGDFFSPLKSDRSTLKTYYEQYWLLTISYMFFWMVIHRYLEKEGVESLFSLESLAECINKTIDALTTIMNK